MFTRVSTSVLKNILLHLIISIRLLYHYFWQVQPLDTLKLWHVLLAYPLLHVSLHYIDVSSVSFIFRSELFYLQHDIESILCEE